MQPQDAIDFTDNDIQILGNFPLSPRIQTLLLARNRISTIQPNLPNAIPKLKNLVLASNQLIELSDLDVLGKFARLTHLVLADNPVTKKEVGFPVYNSSFEVEGGRLTASAALPLLGGLAMSHSALPRLPKGQAGGAGKGH